MSGRGHVLDVTDVTARLTLSNTVSTRDVAAIRRHCRRIPEQVRTLHLDLAAVTRFEDGVLSAVRGVVRDWRRSRQGDCRLDYTSPLLVARVEEHRRPATAGASTPMTVARVTIGGDRRAPAGDIEEA